MRTTGEVMRILLTGANGYIGKRLLPILTGQGHDVVCCVRDRNRFAAGTAHGPGIVSVLEVDFLEAPPEEGLPEGIDAAYYLVHSMSDAAEDFEAREERAARNFLELSGRCGAGRIVYLGGIANGQELSRHLASRRRVEDVLREGTIPVTALRAGIVVGSGSASFEIVRDLVEKLPVMVTPRWLNTRTQPIAVRNVLQFLEGVLQDPESVGQSYDIGGPEVLTYKEMLLQFAAVRDLRRWIFTLPVLTPKLSSYWLYFVTSTSYKLAVRLVNSMKVEVVARPNDLAERLGITLLTYRQAVEMAFDRIGHNDVASSWKDSLVSSGADGHLLSRVAVPEEGCLRDRQRIAIQGDPELVRRNIWSIGGNRGWYWGDRLWKLRGMLDKLAGGVGLRRGRTSPDKICPGDTLDFWRVLVADRVPGRLLLLAEMKLPGEAWLEFRIERDGEKAWLVQTATYRPKGLWGRLYWYALLPVHAFLFEGMARNIVKYRGAGGE